jgi:hypothetical protein
VTEDVLLLVGLTVRSAQRVHRRLQAIPHPHPVPAKTLAQDIILSDLRQEGIEVLPGMRFCEQYDDVEVFYDLDILIPGSLAVEISDRPETLADRCNLVGLRHYARRAGVECGLYLNFAGPELVAVGLPDLKDTAAAR